MKVRANYPNASPNKVNNLFFSLTEDYIQETEVIRKSLSPFSKKIKENLAAVWSVIKPERKGECLIRS